MADQPLSPILVGGGLVETRDSTLFKEGELIKAQDAYYKPGNPALWSVPGRRAFNTIPLSGPVLGGRYLEYDGAPDVIVVHLGRKLMEAPAGFTGEFKATTEDALNSIGVKTFDAVHYNNRQILMDGVNRNRVREKDGTYRFQGMLANVEPPAYSNTGSGTGFFLVTGDKITYWIEERVKDAAGNILRRNAVTGAAQTVVVTGTNSTIKPVITRPRQVNPDATHWAVYATATNGVFPVGASVAEAPIATESVEDIRTEVSILNYTNAQGGVAAALAQLTQPSVLARGTGALPPDATIIPINPTLPTGDLYQTVAVTLDNVTLLFAKNGPAPISTTGDVMEDAVIMLDANDRSRVWFTYPDNIDATPYTNFVRFETKDADEVQWARFIGRAAVVALRDSLWRIDTLPQPTDSAFQIGRVKSQLEGAHGGIGPLTAAPFSFGEKNLLAYASRAGIFVTDGETWELLTSDVDWLSRVDITKLDQAFMENSPLDFRLEFTYTPIGGALNSETMFLHYHPSHVKASPMGFPMAKVTVPVRRGGRCKFLANVSGQDVIFSGQQNGIVYREWIGQTDPLGDIEFDILTGEKFPSGVGRKARAKRVWVHHQKGLADQRATSYSIQHTEGIDDVEEARTFPLKRKEHTSLYADLEGESFQFGVRATNPPAPVGIDFFVADFEDTGEATSAGEE